MAADTRFALVVLARTGQASRALGKLKLDTESTFKGAARAASDFARQTVQVASAITAAGTAIAAFALKTSAAFETAFSEVQTISNFSEGTTRRLRTQIDALTEATGTKAVDATRALYQIISAGATDAADATSLLTNSVKLAKAGVAELRDTADLLTTVTNAYGLDVGSTTDKLADMVFETVRLGKTTVPELSVAIGRMATVSDLANVPLSEMFGTVAGLTKIGLSTEEAVTAIRRTVLTLISPTQKEAKAFKQLGIEFGSAAIKSKGLAGVFADIAQKTKGNAEAVRALFGNVRAFVGAASLATTRGLSEFTTISAQVEDATGSVDRALAQFSDDLQFKFEKAATKFQNRLRKVGEALTPLATEILDRVTEALGKFVDVLQRWAKLVEENGGGITAFLDRAVETLKKLAVIVAAGALARYVFGLATALRSLAIALGLASAAAGPVTAALTVLSAIAGVVGVKLAADALHAESMAASAEKAANAIADAEDRIASFGSADLGTLRGSMLALKGVLLQVERGVAATAGEWREFSQAAALGGPSFERAGREGIDVLAEQLDAAKAGRAELYRVLFGAEDTGAAGAAAEAGSGLADRMLDAATDRARQRAPELAGVLSGTLHGPDPAAAIPFEREAISAEKLQAQLLALPEPLRATIDSIVTIGEKRGLIDRVRAAFELFSNQIKVLEERAKSAKAVIGRKDPDPATPPPPKIPYDTIRLQVMLDKAQTDAFDKFKKSSEAHKKALKQAQQQVEAFRRAYAAAATELGRAMIESALTGKRVWLEFRQFIMRNVIQYLSQQFAKLLLRLAPGGLGFLGEALFGLASGGGGGGSRLAAAPELRIPTTQVPVSVRVTLGPESLVEVMTSSGTARRSLYRNGVLPEARAYGAR